MPNTDETNHKDSATSNKEKEKKHDSGSADLEKVTDFAEVHTIFKIIKILLIFFREIFSTLLFLGKRNCIVFCSRGRHPTYK